MYLGFRTSDIPDPVLIPAYLPGTLKTRGYYKRSLTLYLQVDCLLCLSHELFNCSTYEILSTSKFEIFTRQEKKKLENSQKTIGILPHHKLCTYDNFNFAINFITLSDMIVQHVHFLVDNVRIYLIKTYSWYA